MKDLTLHYGPSLAAGVSATACAASYHLAILPGETARALVVILAAVWGVAWATARTQDAAKLFADAPVVRQ